MSHTIDGTAEEIPADDAPSLELAVVPTDAGSIIRAEDPDEILAKAAQIATSLAGLIESQGLAVAVGGKRKHVEVGGWQALGTMLGALGGQPLHAETVWTRVVRDPATGDAIRRTYTATVKRYYRKDQGGGLREETTFEVDGYDWEACVEIRTGTGVLVGRAEAMCSRSEATWAQREEFAIRSMAETRAESRAYRRAVGWIITLAGFNPTPAEEMGHTPGADHDAPAWAAPAPDDAKVAMLAALESLMGRETAVEYAKALAAQMGGTVPAIVAGWAAALPDFIAAGHARQQAAAPAAGGSDDFAPAA